MEKKSSLARRRKMLASAVRQRIKASPASPATPTAPGTPPAGPGIWTGSNPVLPICGTWQTWITRSSAEFQPERVRDDQADKSDHSADRDCRSDHYRGCDEDDPSAAIGIDSQIRSVHKSPFVCR